MTVEEFWDHVKEVRAGYGTRLRLGQVWFSELYAIRPDLANLVRGTDVDPFHDDRRLPEANEFIRVNWPYETPGMF